MFWTVETGVQFIRSSEDSMRYVCPDSHFEIEVRDAILNVNVRGKPRLGRVKEQAAKNRGGGRGKIDEPNPHPPAVVPEGVVPADKVAECLAARDLTALYIEDVNSGTVADNEIAFRPVSSQPASLRVQMASRFSSASRTRFISSTVSTPSLRSSFAVEIVCTCCKWNAPGFRTALESRAPSGCPAKRSCGEAP